MTEADYPRTLALYGSSNPRPGICTLHFTPLGGVPWFSTRIRLNGAQDVVAVLEGRAGDHWRTSARVSVTFGACATAASGDALPPDWQPTIKISVPEMARLGEVITVRTVITHPMETGLRLNSGNQYVPLRIIERSLCYVNDVLALDIRLAPAISTNPYLAFQLRADQSGKVRMEWQDTTGAVYRESAALVVT